MISTLEKNQQLAGQLAVLLTAFLWSTSGLFIKLVDWHPFVITGVRSAIAALFILGFRVFFPPKKGLKNRPFPHWAAAIAYAITMLTFVVANTLTTTANVIILQYSAPVWAALLGWRLVKEKPHWEQWGAMAIVFGGLLIFLWDALGTGALLGNGLAVLSGITLGATSVFLRMLKDGNPADAMLLAHVIAAAIGLPFVFLYPPSLTAANIIPMVYMGTIQLGLASIIYSYGIKRISAVQAMLTAMIEPIFSPLWVLIVLGERPSILALIGGTLIITAVIASSIIGRRRDMAK